MVVDVKELLDVMLCLSLIILVIVAIVFLVKMMGTLKKVNKVVDEVDVKVNKLNGLFDIIDTTTDILSSFNDKITSTISNGISWLLNRKKKGDKDE